MCASLPESTMLSVDVIQWRITLELCTLTPAYRNNHPLDPSHVTRHQDRISPVLEWGPEVLQEGTFYPTHDIHDVICPLMKYLCTR